MTKKSPDKQIESLAKDIVGVVNSFSDINVNVKKNGIAHKICIKNKKAFDDKKFNKLRNLWMAPNSLLQKQVRELLKDQGNAAKPDLTSTIKADHLNSSTESKDQIPKNEKKSNEKCGENSKEEICSSQILGDSDLQFDSFSQIDDFSKCRSFGSQHTDPEIQQLFNNHLSCALDVQESQNNGRTCNIVRDESFSSSVERSASFDKPNEIHTRIQANANTSVVVEEDCETRVPKHKDASKIDGTQMSDKVYEQYNNKKIGMENFRSSTCYINACLQVLLHIPHEIWQVWQSSLELHKNSCNITQCIACHISEIFINYKKCEENEKESYVSPTTIYNMLGRPGIFEKFKKGVQQDVHEFLLLLIDSLKKTSCSPPRIFEGLLYTITVCIKCNKESEMTFKDSDPFEVLTFPFSNDMTSTETGIAAFLNSETVKGFTCSNCKKEVPFCTRTKKFVLLPDILIVHFGRFDFKDEGLKITKAIDCNTIVQIPDTYSAIHTYELMSVIEHYGGTLESGHYEAIIKTSATEYHRFSDKQVTLLESSDSFISNENIYIAIYQKIGTANEQKSKESTAKTFNHEDSKVKKDFSKETEIEFNTDATDHPPHTAVTNPFQEKCHESCGVNDCVGHVTIPPIFFSTHWIKGEQSFTGKWTNTFNSHFEKVNPFCVLIFKSHEINYGNNRNIKYTPFYAYARCKMNGCFRYKFSIQENLEENRSFTAHIVIIGGSFNHNGDQSERRHISGEERKDCAEKLKSVHASVLVGKLLAQKDSKVLLSGNLNHSPSHQILHTIKSEEKRKSDLDQDFHQYICKLIKKYDEDDELRGKHLNGFIQGYTLKPSFSVTLFTEKQLTEMIQLSKESTVILYFDATGKIFLNPPGSSKKTFYYCTVLESKDWRPTVASLEFVTNGHTSNNIHHSLVLKAEALRKLSPNKWPVVHLIETDFSKAMIQAACKAFNNWDLQVYLDKTHEKLTKVDVRIQEFTVIHVCSTHVKKAGLKRIRKFTDNDEIKLLLRSALDLLIHATDYEYIKDIYSALFKLFGFENETIAHNTLLEQLRCFKSFDYNLQKDIKEETYPSVDTEDNDDDLKTVDEQFEEYQYNNTNKEQSRFFQDFNELQIQITKSKKLLLTDVKNNYFCPQFLTYLLNELIPYLPLWTAIIIKEFDLRRNSNATVESWNNIIKNIVFRGEMRQLIPRAIETLKENVMNRLLLRKTDLRTSRQKQNEEKKKNKKSEKETKKKEETKQKMMQKLVDLEEVLGNCKATDEQNVNDNEELFCSAKKKKRTQSVIASEKIKTQIFKEMTDDLKDKTAKKRSSAEFEKGPVENESISDENDLGYDMYEEGWNRSCKKENPGFDEYEKSFSEWNEQRKFYQNHAKKRKNCNLSEPNHDTVDPDDVNSTFESSSLEKPWIKTTNKYPSNWRSLNFKISKYVIKESNLKTLLPGVMSHEDVLNAFLKICDVRKEGKEPLFFDSHFFSSIEKDASNIRPGFYNWVNRNNAWSRGIWLIPKGGRSHWSLIVVVFRTRTILHIDSLHQKVNKVMRGKLCSFIDTTYDRANLSCFDWSQWTWYEPTDVPHQEMGQSNGNNCGIHMCVWSYIIFTSQYFKFTEDDMDCARKWIFDTIVESSSSGCINADEQPKKSKSSQTIRKADITKMKVQQSPPYSKSSTLQYCAFLRHLIKYD